MSDEYNPFAQILGGFEVDGDTDNTPEDDVTHPEDDDDDVTGDDEYPENDANPDGDDDPGHTDDDAGEDDDESPEPGEADGTDDDAADEDPAYYPETLDDLVAAYDGDDDKLKALVVSEKKNGEKVTLSQVLDYWEVGESVNKKSQELSAKLREVETERTRVHTGLADKLNEQSAVLEAIEKIYLEAGAAELETLRDVDPAAYAVRKVDLTERAKALEAVKAKVHERSTELTAEEQQVVAGRRQEYMARQTDLMLDLIPEWKDKKAFNDDFQGINTYMKGLGFQDEEVSTIVDARVRRIIRDAMLYNGIRDKASPAKKRVIRKPKRKSVKGGSTDKSTAKRDAGKLRRKRAAKSGNPTQQRAAIADLLINGI